MTVHHTRRCLLNQNNQAYLTNLSVMNYQRRAIARIE